MDDFLQEIRIGFLEEASEFIVQNESMLLSFEAHGIDHETLKNMKRIFHNLKGSGKAVGFDELSSFCHKVENLIVNLGSRECTKSDIEVLLVCNDALRDQMKLLRDNLEYKCDFDLQISLLNTILESSEEESFETISTKETDLINNKNIFGDAQDLIENLNNKKLNEVKNENSGNDSFIKVHLKRIDEILDIFSEQIIYLSSLEHLIKKNDFSHFDVEKELTNLKKMSYELQQKTLSLRMINLSGVKAKLERVVRDSAKETGKRVKFQFIGVASEVDKNISDKISDPLIHMIRNSIDHGIESLEERRKTTKPEESSLIFEARNCGGVLEISITDDGQGLNKEKIIDKAIKNNLIKSSDGLSDREIYDLIFENGFSTKEVVSEISGRGVGMNVVREVINDLGGNIEIENSPGIGLKFILRIPMTLSLFNGLLVETDETKYIVPSSQIFEILNENEILSAVDSGDKFMLQCRDEIIESYDLLSMLMNRPSERKLKKGYYLVSKMGSIKKIVRVDRVHNILKIAQKPVPRELEKFHGAAGVSILGNGHPVIIVDLNKILFGVA